MKQTTDLRLTWTGYSTDRCIDQENLKAVGLLCLIKGTVTINFQRTDVSETGKNAMRIANHADLDNKHSDQGDALIKSISRLLDVSVSLKG